MYRRPCRITTCSDKDRPSGMLLSVTLLHKLRRGAEEPYGRVFRFEIFFADALFADAFLVGTFLAAVFAARR